MFVVVEYISKQGGELYWTHNLQMNASTENHRLKVHSEEFDLDATDGHPCYRKIVEITRDDISGVWCDSCKITVKKLPVIYTYMPADEYGGISICSGCIEAMLSVFESRTGDKFTNSVAL